MSTDMAKTHHLDDPANIDKMVKRGYFYQLFFTMRCFTFERMMGPDMVSFVLGIAEDLYPGDHEKQKELALNHAVFFNTQPQAGSIVWGVILGMEVERAKTGQIPNEMIQSIKSALAGPIAGVGDTVIQSLLIPICLSIAIGLSSTGSALGPIVAFLLYSIIVQPFAYFMYRTGVTLGIEGAEKVLTSGLKDRVLTSIEALGLVVIGAVVASTANITTALSYVNGEMVLSAQEILDSIMPGLLPLCLSFIVYYLLKVKKIKPIMMMGILLVVSIVGYFLGVF